MFKYNLLTTSSFKINEIIVKKIFKEVEKIVEENQNGTLNIVFVSEDEIKNLNNKYRKINKVTDVLSFHYFDSFKYLGEEEIAGEIVMCEKRIISQGNDFGLGPEKEFYKLLIHSVLHIIGYNHEKDDEYEVMKDLEARIWKII